MAKQANKTAIGLFVVGAIILLVVALVVLGSGRFFKETDRFVAFFDGSVKGLTVGAPVMFRGVRIGKVEDFSVYYKRAEREFKIPVLLTLYPEKVVGIGIEMTELEQKKQFQKLLEEGLRAELQMQSLVTGQLGVQLDFHPDAPLNFHGLEEFNLLLRGNNIIFQYFLKQCEIFIDLFHYIGHEFTLLGGNGIILYSNRE